MIVDCWGRDWSLPWAFSRELEALIRLAELEAERDRVAGASLAPVRLGDDPVRRLHELRCQKLLTDYVRNRDRQREGCEALGLPWPPLSDRVSRLPWCWPWERQQDLVSAEVRPVFYPSDMAPDDVDVYGLGVGAARPLLVPADDVRPLVGVVRQVPLPSVSKVPDDRPPSPLVPARPVRRAGSGDVVPTAPVIPIRRPVAPAGYRSLADLVDPSGSPCPICDQFECSHEFYGKEHYRVGDTRDRHPIISRRHIPAPDRILSPAGQVLFQKGSLMSDDEAVRYGVAIPGQPGPPRKKGRRQPRPAGPDEAA